MDKKYNMKKLVMAAAALRGDTLQSIGNRIQASQPQISSIMNGNGQSERVTESLIDYVAETFTIFLQDTEIQSMKKETIRNKLSGII